MPKKNFAIITNIFHPGRIVPAGTVQIVSIYLFRGNTMQKHTVSIILAVLAGVLTSAAIGLHFYPLLGTALAASLFSIIVQID